MKKKGFTLVELLVVIAIIAVLVAILVPVIGSALAEARKGACQANLKTIGMAFREYDRTKNGFARITGHTSGDASAVYAPAGTSATLASVAVAPMNEVWAMIEAGLLPETAFKCGGDSGYTVRTVAGTTLQYGWAADTQFSYGIQFPYDTNTTPTTSLGNPAIATDVTNGYAANAVMMADMSKRGDATPVVTTATDYQNHSDGIAYLTRAGNVGFNKPATGANSVINGDEIYQDAGSGGGVCPANATDAVICPGAITLP